jgi:hypothetical protein
MSRNPCLRTAALAVVVSFGVIGQGVLADTAGAVTSTKTELRNGQLRMEGHAFPGQFVAARSTTSSAGARADQNGLFKIQAGNFTAPDCKVTVSDNRTAIATVTLAGCTPSAAPVAPTPAPPTGSCTITPAAPVSLTQGKSAVVFFQTTGCNTTFNSGATPTPVQWKLVAGSIPTGMTGPNFQGTTAGSIDGIPSIAGTYRFTMQVIDQVGATDQENVTVNVA